MGKNYFISALMFFSLHMSTTNAQEHVLANIDYSLNTKEIQSLTLASLNGNGDAAERLVQYYLNSDKSLKKAKQWARIGAENNSAKVQFMYFHFLADSRKEDEQLRALFWLRRSAENGYEIAKYLYEECGSIDAKMNDEENTACFGPDAESPYHP